MNDKLEKLKKEYLEIKPSDQLKDSIEAILKSHKSRSSPWGGIMGAVAGFAIIVTVSLNMSPALAATISDVPGMGGIVKVLTFDRYEIKDNGYHAITEVPKIEGLLDQKLQDKLNQDFKENANTLMLAFESDMKDLQKQFPGENVHLGIDSGYIVKTDNANTLAIDVYSANTVGSSSTTHKFYTIDKKSQTLVTLSSLFKTGVDYITPLNNYIRAQMRRVNEKGENTYWVDDLTFGPFMGIKTDQNFYINNNGNIVICFDKYVVGPGSSGSPEFIIPEEVVKAIK